MTPTQESAGQAGQVSPFYFIPAGFLLGAMLGASATVVLTRRLRRGNTDTYSHPFPAEGGIASFEDTRDEQEKRWIENRQVYSEDAYETDSNGSFPPLPQQTYGFPRRWNSDSSQIFIGHGRPWGGDVAKMDVPISDSFYDEALAESRVLELNLSSDEEPPAPYSRLRKDSLPSRTHENLSKPLRDRQEAFSLFTSNSGARRSPFSVASPAQCALSPRQMRDLFFINSAGVPKDQWVPAEQLLAEGEDSGEEDVVKHAILQAGANERTRFSQRGRSLAQTKGIPSALSTIEASRRLVKLNKQVSSVQEHGEQDTEDVYHRKYKKPLPESPSIVSGLRREAFSRIEDVIRTGWSQRGRVPLGSSPNDFSSPLSSYGDLSNNRGKVVTFGVREGNDGIEHRLGLLP